MDYLEKPDSGYCALYPLDVPDKSAHVNIIHTQIKNSDKCVRGRGRGRSIAKDCIKMMSILAGKEDEPWKFGVMLQP